MAKRKLKTNDYIALSAYLRAREARLLSRETLERMLAEPNFAEACRLAAEAGYADMSDAGVQGIHDALEAHLRAELSELREMLPDPELLRLVSLQYDCHNAKVLVKSEGDAGKAEALYSPSGCYTLEQLRAVYDEESGSGELDPDFAEALREAKLTLARTGNPQLADFLLDKAYFAALLKSAKETGRRFFLDYVQARIDKANLRSAVRTLRLPRRSELLAGALIPGGTVEPEQLRDPGLNREELARLYAPTVFAAAAEETDMSAFEKAADNAERELVSGCALISFGPEVVLEYVSALENEVMSLRILLTGKRMGIDADTLRERLRESYV
ncbi:MAG: V-type ATPase subunit [Oscillospiraceae bacterium]|nr:V-type ATPase subunit [Oscillospiraceae bacterium]